jgi:hypothetical protein
VEVEDVLNLGVERVLERKAINAKHTVEVEDVLNLGVERVLERKAINALNTVEVEDVKTYTFRALDVQNLKKTPKTPSVKLESLHTPDSTSMNLKKFSKNIRKI